MPTYAVGQKLKASDLQTLSDLIEDSTQSVTVTSDSAAITTTAAITMTLVAAVEAGKTYQISSYAKLSSSVAADSAYGRIRLTDGSGTILQGGQITTPTTSAFGFSLAMHTEWTASSTGNQTFVHTVVRNGGTGNIIHRASSTEPGILTCRLKG